MAKLDWRVVSVVSGSDRYGKKVLRTAHCVLRTFVLETDSAESSGVVRTKNDGATRTI